MISEAEIKRLAKRDGFAPDIIEKDYVLAWALSAIYSNPRLSKFLVFKGGTCISKVYAGIYRLSEDLDFSAAQVTDPVELSYDYFPDPALILDIKRLAKKANVE